MAAVLSGPADQVPTEEVEKGDLIPLKQPTMSEKFVDGYTLVTLGRKMAFQRRKAEPVYLLIFWVTEVGTGFFDGDRLSPHITIIS